MGPGARPIFCAVGSKKMFFLAPFLGSKFGSIFGAGFSTLVRLDPKSGAKFGPKNGVKNWTHWLSFPTTMVAETGSTCPRFGDQWVAETSTNRAPKLPQRIGTAWAGSDRDLASTVRKPAQASWADVPTASSQTAQLAKPRRPCHTCIYVRAFLARYDARTCVIPAATLAPKVEPAISTPCFISASTKMSSFFDPVFGAKKNELFIFLD